MTAYIAAYDTESLDCLEGVRQIVRVHEQHTMPATFFIVAGLLDAQRAEYVALLRDHPLFEIACHSYTHMPLVDTPRYGAAGPKERYPHELVDSKNKLEDVFSVAVTGFRPPVSAPDGLQTAPAAVAALANAGYSYVSSMAWGPDFSLPAPLRPPCTYAAQGFAGLWELPACGWHENLLKGHNNMGPVLVNLFPPDLPAAAPKGYIRSPYEELAVNNRPFLDCALRENRSHVSFIWHPWSLRRLDPPMRMLDLTFTYVRGLNMAVMTFAGLLKSIMSCHEANLP